MTQTALRAKIENWMDQNFESVVSDLQALARVPSVSRADLASPGAPFGPDVKKMLDFAVKMADDYGLYAENHEGYCASVFLGDRENSLGIFGHLDVVPEGEGWLYPPYGATREGDYLIGRGVADDKMACAIGLGLIRMFRELKIPLRHGLRLVMGGSEETGMADMEYFSRTQKMPAASIVPDSSFPANFAQKGMMNAALSIPAPGAYLLSLSGGAVENMVPPTARAVLALPKDVVEAALQNEVGITVSQVDGKTMVFAQGLAAHAARPWLGRSAIHMLSRALVSSGLFAGVELKTLEAVSELSFDQYGEQAGIACSDPETGRTTMVVGLASTKDGRIRLTVDARLSIAIDQAECRADFEAYLEKSGFSLDSIRFSEPFYLPKDGPIIQALQKVYREHTGRTDEPTAMGGGTYSRKLTNAVTFGPGFPDWEKPDFLPEGHGGAHEPDEIMYIPNMRKAMAIYADALIALDGVADAEGGNQL